MFLSSVRVSSKINDLRIDIADQHFARCIEAFIRSAQPSLRKPQVRVDFGGPVVDPESRTRLLRGANGALMQALLDRASERASRPTMLRLYRGFLEITPTLVFAATVDRMSGLVIMMTRPDDTEMMGHFLRACLSLVPLVPCLTIRTPQYSFHTRIPIPSE